METNSNKQPAYALPPATPQDVSDLEGHPMETDAQLLLVYRSEWARQTLRRLVQGDRWNLHLTCVEATPAAMDAAALSEPAAIAVVELSAQDAALPAWRQRIEELPATRLIALCRAEERRCTPLLRLIQTHCFAVLPLPFAPRELERLIDSLLWMDAALRGAGSRSVALDTRTLESDSPSMQRVIASLHKLASVDAPVLIQGETGSGKELVARAIHRCSARRRGPFIAVNCGAIPHELMQSSFFGYEKGAFTDAGQRRHGCIEAAAGGTLFLDEVGDLPFDMQVCLLRVLENHCIQRLGSTEEIPVDLRILAATNVDLMAAIARGDFREDLYYRLDVLHLYIPPLRERLEDLPRLVADILARHASERPQALKGISDEALRHMKQYHWPGNVRELTNHLRRAMIMCRGGWIEPEDLTLPAPVHSAPTTDLDRQRDAAERQAILAALLRCEHNVSCAARVLDIARITLYRLMEKHGIERERPAGRRR